MESSGGSSRSNSSSGTGIWQLKGVALPSLSTWLLKKGWVDLINSNYDKVMP